MKIPIIKREKVVEHYLEGKSQKVIASILSISRCAVQHIIKKNINNLPLSDRPRKGRPPKLNAYDKRLIIRESKKHSFKTANEIIKACNLTNIVSNSTIKAILRKYGLYGRIAAKKPLLTKKHKKQRKAFYQMRKNWNSIDWQKYIFTDEVKLTAGMRPRQYVRRPVGSRYKEQYCTKSVKYPLSVMCWGAIRSDGKRMLILCQNSVDSNEYIRVIKEAVSHIYNSRFVIQQDGARAHTSKQTMEFFKHQGIRILKDWPSQSPDLNIIEGL